MIQLYYYYEPLSIKSYIEEKLLLMAGEYDRDKFLTKIITNINVAIEEIIVLLMGKNIQAILSI